MAKGSFNFSDGRFVDTYADLNKTIAGIQQSGMDAEKMRLLKEQHDIENKRADAQLKMQKEANQRIVDDRVATSNALTTQAKLGAPGHGNVGLDYAQSRSQQSLSDNVNSMNKHLDDQFRSTFRDVLSKQGVDLSGNTEKEIKDKEQVFMRKVADGDLNAKRLYLDAKSFADDDVDTLQQKLGGPVDLTDLLSGNSDIKAMSTPTLEQEYIARKNAATASGNPAAIKAVDDAMLPTVQAAREAEAKANIAWNEREDANLKLRADVLKKTIGSGGTVSKGTSTDNLDKLMTSMNIDQSNWLNDDKSAIFSLANRLKDDTKYKGIDVNKYIADELRTGDYTAGEIFSGSHKIENLDKLTKQISDRVDKHKKAGIAYKVGKGNNSTNLDSNMAEMDKLIAAREALVRGGGDRLSASTNRLDAIFSGLKPTKQQLEEAIGKDTKTTSTGSGSTESNQQVIEGDPVKGVTSAAWKPSEKGVPKTTGTYLENLRQDESGNTYNVRTKVKNPDGTQGTAYGAYQFTQDAAKDAVKALNNKGANIKVDWSAPIGKQGWESPEVQDKMAMWRAEKDGESLAKAGIPLTQVNLKGAHMFGLAGFKKIMKSKDITGTGEPLDAKTKTLIKNHLPKGIPDDQLVGELFKKFSENFTSNSADIPVVLDSQSKSMQQKLVENTVDSFSGVTPINTEYRPTEIVKSPTGPARGTLRDLLLNGSKDVTTNPLYVPKSDRYTKAQQDIINEINPTGMTVGDKAYRNFVANDAPLQDATLDMVGAAMGTKSILKNVKTVGEAISALVRSGMSKAKAEALIKTGQLKLLPRFPETIQMPKGKMGAKYDITVPAMKP